MFKEINNCLEAALKYASIGFSVIPTSQDKIPPIKWKKYEQQRADEKTIREWWKKYPNANVGIVTGAISGIVVVDVENSGRIDDLPKTVCSKTGGGGWHFFYRHPNELIRNSGRIRELTDIRGDGGYVVVSPSLHLSGKKYEWINSPDEMEFSEYPSELFPVLKRTISLDRDWKSIVEKEILVGSRNDTATSIIGKILSTLPQELWSTIGWGGLKEWNNKQCVEPLDEEELLGVFKSIGGLELAKREKKEVVSFENIDRIKKVEKPEREVSFFEWQETIKDNFPDLLFPAEVALSIIAQILIKDITNPFALVLVDVPSSGKTITINFFDGNDGITYASDKFTPASFVSNATNVKKSDLSKIDLLPRLRYKMFLLRDLATLFSKRDDDLNECLGLLTRVLDGEGLCTDSGVHGQRQYVGEYLFMILAGSTPIPPRVWKMMGSLGSRLFFLNIRSRDKSETELADQLTTTAYKEKEKICRLATKGFIQTLWHKYKDGFDWDKKVDEQECKLIIGRCAKLLARLRGVINIWKDRSQDGEVYDYTQPIIEKPDRINQAFYNLCRGHAIVSSRTQISRSDLKLIIEIAIDSAPTVRANLFRKLLDNDGEMKTGDVMAALNCSRPTAHKEMEALKILGVCDMTQDSSGFVGEPEKIIHLASDLKWFLSDECKNIREMQLALKQSTLSNLL